MTTMNTKTRSNAERFGRWLGCGWRGYVRREQRAVVWMVAQGLPAGGAKALLWVVKLVVLGVLLYVAFWLALLLLFAVAVAWAAQNSAPPDEDEWPFQTLDELSKTPGYDPVLHNDIGHSDYVEEDEDR